MPDDPALQTLLAQLQLERLDRDLFLGDPGEGERRLFGGLIAAQSVVAAYKTVDGGDSALHSLHSYFLRPGRHDVPVRYVVYRIRDGRTFTTRDVVAYQAGEAIFNLSCSFTRAEAGPEHQGPMPDVPGPDGLPDWELARPDPHTEMPAWIRHSPVEQRAIDHNVDPEPGATPRRRVWMRVKGTLPEDPMVHAAMITYASDRGLLATARHAHNAPRGDGFGASLDHAIWFHHPPRFDGWLLFTSESPIAHAARALIIGQMHREDGTRVATVVQEGLIRVPRTG